MTTLLELKEKLVRFYGKYEVYITPIVKFIVAFAALMTIDRNIGYMELVSSTPVALILGLLCAILPVGGTIFIAAVVILADMYALSIEVCLVALLLFVLIYFIYFRFAPRQGMGVLLTPICFRLNIPYVIPVGMGLETTILPSTWHETGVALFGDLGNFDYELQVVSGLDPQGFRMENWVGKGTQGAFEETQFTHPAFVARVNYNGVKKFKGLRVGASFYYNQPSKNSSKPLRNQGEKYPLTIVTADAQYKSPNNNLIARGNIVYGHLGNSNALTKVNNNSSSASGYPNSTVAETAVSYAAEVGYNVGSFFSRKAPRIYPFVRYEYYNPMQSVEKGSNKLADRRLQKSVITAGLNYYALPNLVVKADYAHRIVGKGDYNSQNMVSVGIAYIGWFLSR